QNDLGACFEDHSFASLRVLRDVHSFPTRRSSDLGFTNRGVIELTSVVNAQNATLNVSSGSLVNALGGQINVLAGTGGPRNLGVQDRKSTRLNSNHVATSYAVSSLQNKNGTNTSIG